jgi:hypothetical protein
MNRWFQKFLMNQLHQQYCNKIDQLYRHIQRIYSNCFVTILLQIHFRLLKGSH